MKSLELYFHTWLESKQPLDGPPDPTTSPTVLHIRGNSIIACMVAPEVPIYGYTGSP
jgi:hypothetical protein